MKLLTRDTDYALRALCLLSKRKDRISPVAELVEELKIPRPFLRKLLQVLSGKRILKSYKGKGGGFCLAVSANKIFLLDLVKIFQGPLQLNECLFKRMVCPNIKSCLLRKKITSIERYVTRELKSITVASLLG